MKPRFADIMVSTPLERISGRKIRVFLLPDGNERGKAEGTEGYGSGGKKVVEVIERIAERGDVDEVTFAILSKENIAGRDDAFLNEIYGAFMGLGVKIINDNTLVSRGVRIDIEGDLDFLRMKSSMGMSLANMVEGVARQTHQIESPGLRVKFAFAYPVDYLQKRNIDVVVRSGMEGENLFRSSGLVVPDGTVCYGLTDLWPQLKSEKLMRLFDDYRRRDVKRFASGNPAETIKHLTEKLNARFKNVYLPVTDLNGSEMQQSIAALPKNWQVYRDGSDVRIGQPSNDLQRTIIATSDDKFYDYYLKEKASEVDGIVLPGQEGHDFVLPRNVDIGYANLRGSGLDPKEISETVNEAAIWATSTQSWRGTKRVTVQIAMDTLAEDAVVKDKRKLSGLIEAPDRTTWYGRIDQDVAVAAGFKSVEAFYDYYGDLFVAEQLKDVGELGMPIESAPQFMAFTNIALTVYFMTYYPHLMEMPGEWKVRAKGLAKYMMAIYLGDEAIFDVEIPGESKDGRRKRLANIADVLKRQIKSNIATGALRAKEGLSGQEKTVMAAVLNNLKGVFDETADRNNHWFKKRYKEDLIGFYDSCLNEWEDSEAFDQRARKLVTDSKYLDSLKHHYMPNSFVSRMIVSAKAFNKSGSSADLADFKLFLHLLECRRSIGAGLSFRTLSMYLDEADYSTEARMLLEELVALNDLYYRVLNDLAGFARNPNDRESTRDSVRVLEEKFIVQGVPKQEAVLLAVAELKKYADHLEIELRSKRTQLIKEIPEIGIPMVRADLAAEVYKNGHYRTVDRKTMSIFMANMLNLGGN